MKKKNLDRQDNPQFRLVVDFRRLNDQCIPQTFLLPQVPEILESLGHNTYYTILDLVSGVHQILVREQDQPKLAFSSPNGHYQYKKVPFGLRSSPAAFLKCMNATLAGLMGQWCLVYMDNVIVFAKNISDHQSKLVDILEQMRRCNLRLQPDKCQFLMKEVTYLGHILSESGVRLDPEKIKVLQEYQHPKNVKSLQSFLGFCNYYRRFVQNFSEVVLPLTKLLCSI